MKKALHFSMQWNYVKPKPNSARAILQMSFGMLCYHFWYFNYEIFKFLSYVYIVGVPYRVDSPFEENVQVTNMYSIHRSKRQSGSGTTEMSMMSNNTATTATATPTPTPASVTATTQSPSTTTTTATVTSSPRATTSTQATTTTTVRPIGSSTFPSNSTIIQVTGNPFLVIWQCFQFLRFLNASNS